MFFTQVKKELQYNSTMPVVRKQSKVNLKKKVDTHYTHYLWQNESFSLIWTSNENVSLNLKHMNK